MPEYVKIIGTLAAILIPLAFLPQTIKIIRKKNTKGMSVLSYSIYFTGVIVFLVFGILIKSTEMIICQTLNSALSGIVFGMILYNLKKK